MPNMENFICPTQTQKLPDAPNQSGNYHTKFPIFNNHLIKDP